MDNFVVRKNQKPQASLPVINVYTDGAIPIMENQMLELDLNLVWRRRF